MFFLSDIANKKLDLPKPGEALPGRDRAIPTASKHHVSNRRLKMELGYQFKYPTFRQGYTAELIRLET